MKDNIGLCLLTIKYVEHDVLWKKEKKFQEPHVPSRWESYCDASYAVEDSCIDQLDKYLLLLLLRLYSVYKFSGTKYYLSLIHISLVLYKALLLQFVSIWN